jgi:hypothetical protein
MIGFYTILLSIMVLYLAFRFARGSKKKVVTEAV